MLAMLPLSIVADIFLIVVSNGQAIGAVPESRSKLWKSRKPNEPVDLKGYNYVVWEESVEE